VNMVLLARRYGHGWLAALALMVPLAFSNPLMSYAVGGLPASDRHGALAGCVVRETEYMTSENHGPTKQAQPAGVAMRRPSEPIGTGGTL
jgi:hypothetical protein